MIQTLRKQISLKEKGFTLIELMIVIAIIGILAAIAVPQFLSYRMRSYNTAAKAVVNNLKADNANLNAELGTYGHTVAAAATLGGAFAAAAVSNSGVANMSIPATPNNVGARLVGNRTSDSRQFSVGIALGQNMWAEVVEISDVNDNATYVAAARHGRGDTAYGVDADIENSLFSVSNADTFPNAATKAFTMVAVGAATPPADSFTGVAGGGSPSANWFVVR